jgi:hypothetical protein
MTFFYQEMRELIANGHLFLALMADAGSYEFEPTRQ